MRLQDLLAGVPQVEEIQVWGHVLQAGDICLQLAGLARSGQTVTLYGLEYNPTYRAQDTLLGDVVKRPQTNRELLRPEQTSHLWLSGARQIELEQTVYAMGRCTWDNLYNGLCGDWQDLLTLAEFLRQGLVLLPQLAQKSCRDLYWVALSWRGDYDALPLSAPPQSLKLESGDRWQREALSEKWLWSVGEQQNEACSFAASGGQRTFYLDKVELVDIRAQIEQQFDSPLYRQRLTQEEWQENKRETLQLLDDTCPPGCYLPLITYEVLEDFTLDLEAEAYLNQKPAAQPGVLMFAPRLEQERGRHGGQMKAVYLKQPVPPETGEIAVEALSYSYPLPKQVLDFTMSWQVLRPAYSAIGLLGAKAKACGLRLYLLGFLKQGQTVCLYGLEHADQASCKRLEAEAVEDYSVLSAAQTLSLGERQLPLKRQQSYRLSERPVEAAGVLEAFRAQGLKLGGCANPLSWAKQHLVIFEIEGLAELPGLKRFDEVRLTVGEQIGESGQLVKDMRVTFHI